MDRTHDRQLIRRLQMGDEEAVRELADRYSHRIFQMALRHMKNREDAEEVTQDVLMKVYRKIDKFRGDAALSSWIYRITFNTAMSRLRTHRAERAAERRARPHARAADSRTRRRRRRHASLLTGRGCRTKSCCGGSFARQSRTRSRGCPEIYRVPVVLRDIEGLTTEEASTRLRVKDQTLKSRLHRGRVMLRQQLSDFTSGLELHSRRRSRTARPSYRFGATNSGRSLRAGEPRGELEGECRDAADAARVDLFPVVARPVVVGVEAGEEVDRRHPLGDERRIVAAAGARPLTSNPAARRRQLAAARKSASIDGDSSRPLTSTPPLARPTMSRFSIAIVFSIGTARRGRVVGRPEQPALLARKRDEHQRSRKTRALR